MEHGGWKRWIVPALAVLFVLWLLSRARSGSGSGLAQMFLPPGGGGGGQSLPADVQARQNVALDLQLDELKKQFAYNDALRSLDLSVKQTQAQTVSDYGSLYHDLATGQNYPGGFRCPGGGKPRIDPTSGRIVCMNTNQSGGVFTPFVNTITDWANGALKTFLNTEVFPSSSAGKTRATPAPPKGAGGYTPGINPGGGVSQTSVIWGCFTDDCIQSRLRNEV
jgi:hypothetical protein